MYILRLKKITLIPRRRRITRRREKTRETTKAKRKKKEKAYHSCTPNVRQMKSAITVPSIDAQKTNRQNVEAQRPSLKWRQRYHLVNNEKNEKWTAHQQYFQRQNKRKDLEGKCKITGPYKGESRLLKTRLGERHGSGLTPAPAPSRPLLETLEPHSTERTGNKEHGSD